MTPLNDPHAWTNVGVHAGSNGFFLDGVDVFAHEWRPLNGVPDATVNDPQQGRAYAFPVYKVIADGREVVFAAGEFSNNVWGFYVPARSRIAPPPMPGPTQLAPGRRFARRLAPYVPLMAAIFELPWIVLIVMMAMGTRENAGPPDPYWQRQFSLFLILPASAGLIAGLVVLLRRDADRPLARVALAIGCAACAAFVYGFGRGMFAPI